jgi:hypothetical protein
MNLRPLGVEYPRHLNLGAVNKPVAKAQRFMNPITLVVSSENANGIDKAVVVLWLRMHLRIATHETVADEQQPGPHQISQAKHVEGIQAAGLGCFGWFKLVVHRENQVGQIKDVIHHELDLLGSGVADQLIIEVTDTLNQLGHRAREIVTK